ncbi:MAG: METTL5 family protein [Candidatus Thorarchaeota archaeon]
MKIKRKDLEIFLQQLEKIIQPKIKYEQYPTPARVAANLLWFAGIDNDDINQKNVIDLGCGTGILAIGAGFLGANSVIGIDIDIDVLKIAKLNSLENSLNDICHWFCSDVRNLKTKRVNTIIMNPPFGMRKESISRDRDFLLTALTISDVIYSINPYQEKTRKFFIDFCKEKGAEVNSIIKMDFDISHYYDFHSKAKHIIQVDLYKIINKNF